MSNTLRNLSVYNPGTQSSESLKRGFIVRTEVLDALVQVLRTETPESCAKHQLLIGQRGMGKTTLLYRLALAIREDPSLTAIWLPLNFQEEQFNVTDLSVFWRNCLDALIDAAEAQGLPVAEFDALQQRLSNKDADTTLAAFMQAAAQLKRRPLLLVDNLDMVFDRINQTQAWALRATLQEPGAPMIIGAATQPLEQHYDHSQPFYDFLQVRWLDQLDFSETQSLLMRLARDHDLHALQVELARNPARLVPLHLFSGGNLRTLMLLFKVLADGVNHDVQKDIEDLLDACTPLYKARIEALPAQQQAVFVAVALAFDPISAADLDQQLQLGINAVSAQLNKLVQSGLLRKAPTAESKRLRFEVAERFFGIWYLMRANRRDRSRMQWLARFLRDWYASDSAALNQTAETLLAQASDSSGIHAALMTADGVPGARDVRRAALARLPEAERKDYAWADIPKLIKPLGKAAQKKMEREFSARTRGNCDWALEVFRECRANLGALITINEAEAAKLCLLKDPQRCLSILESQPESAERERGRGIIFSEMPNRLVEAEAAYRKSIHLDETDARPWNNLGNLLHDELARLDEAEAAYRTAIRLNEMFAYPWNNLGDLLQYQLGRFEEAEAAYRTGIRLDERDAYPWNGLGNLLQDYLKRFEEAETAYGTAIRLDEADPYPWNGLGNLLQYNLERHQDAEVAYRKAISLDESFAHPWNNLGNLLKNHLSRFEEAEAAYCNAIHLKENYEYPWNNLALLWQSETAIAAKQTEQTLTKLFDYAARSEKLPDAFETLISSLLKAKKLLETLSALEQTDLKIRAQPLVEALRTLKLDAPGHLATLAAEVRETSYQVLKRLAPEFAARVAREMPAMVAGFVLPDSLKPTPPSPDL
jgi:tetratricopeptide (TPR) repeat protein